MRKFALLGLVLVLSTGCGRGWLPHLFRGAPCAGSCGAALPAPVQTGCSNCGTVSPTYDASYAEYPGEIVGGDPYGSGVISSDYYGGRVIDNGVINGGVVTDGTIVDGGVVSPPMAPITSP